MKKAIVLFLVVLALAGLSWAQVLKEPYTNRQLYELLNKVFYNWLGDKSEKLVLVTADGQSFVFPGDPAKVSVETHTIILALARKGQSFKTVTNIIHNHARGVGFNEKDLTALQVFKKLGFVGKFQIFYPETGKIKTFKGRPL